MSKRISFRTARMNREYLRKHERIQIFELNFSGIEKRIHLFDAFFLVASGKVIGRCTIYLIKRFPPLSLIRRRKD
jgi:hypothetical protein